MAGGGEVDCRLRLLRLGAFVRGSVVVVVGAFVGMRVVGGSLGVSVASSVGCSVGAAVGISVGAPVEISVGCFVGNLVAGSGEDCVGGL